MSSHATTGNTARLVFAEVHLPRDSLIPRKANLHHALAAIRLRSCAQALELDTAPRLEEGNKTARRAIGDGIGGQDLSNAALQSSLTSVNAAQSRTKRALVALSLVGAANALDRHVIGMVLPLIRSEFRVSDALLGLLSGPAFAVTYATCGVPLALLADRIGRRRVIAGALAFFSATTAACGLAGGFWQLAAARLATGLGEAGATAPGNALIADLYTADRRVAPLSFFAASGNVGLLLAYFGGGLIAEHYGWRAVFLASAAFGAFALVVLGLAVPEPRPASQMVRLPLQATIAGLWTRPGAAWVVAGASIASIGGYAASAFLPSFLARSHHMSPSAIGLTLG